MTMVARKIVPVRGRLHGGRVCRRAHRHCNNRLDCIDRCRWERGAVGQGLMRAAGVARRRRKRVMWMVRMHTLVRTPVRVAMPGRDRIWLAGPGASHATTRWAVRNRSPHHDVSIHARPLRRRRRRSGRRRLLRNALAPAPQRGIAIAVRCCVAHPFFASRDSIRRGIHVVMRRRSHRFDVAPPALHEDERDEQPQRDRDGRDTGVFGRTSCATRIQTADFHGRASGKAPGREREHCIGCR